MTAKHTPTYYVSNHYVRVKVQTEHGSSDDAVCECWNGGGPNPAGAEYIALCLNTHDAMLAALKKAKELLSRVGDLEFEVCELADAIALAEGRS